MSTCRNWVAKRTQHVAPSNVAICCVQMLRLFARGFIRSTVGKKMAAEHSTTTPCRPNTAYEVQRKPNVYNICPCTKDIV